ncbi:MAG: hypothetical protein LCI00_13360 [Chloroflexi bacterium]|nr:hypothetical protein [Chloroflexota bacterium]MCC6892350.1 hypothetical protein [Anaerolineae bacterium]
MLKHPAPVKAKGAKARWYDTPLTPTPSVPSQAQSQIARSNRGREQEAGGECGGLRQMLKHPAPVKAKGAEARW